MSVNQDTGTPRKVYAMCRNKGYNVSSPDPDAPNEPEMGISDPPPPWYEGSFNAQVISYVWVADTSSAGLGADHRHWMPGPFTSVPSSNLSLSEAHFHNGFVTPAGMLRWSTERDLILAPHEHESDVQRLVNSLGEEMMVLRPKWAFVLATIKPELFTHWKDNGAPELQMIAEREWIGGDVNDRSTWQFQQQPSNEKWASGYRNAVNNFMVNTFGIELPSAKPGGADIAVDSDRHLVRWWSAINRFEFVDETRFG